MLGDVHYPRAFDCLATAALAAALVGCASEGEPSAASDAAQVAEDLKPHGAFYRRKLDCQMQCELGSFAEVTPLTPRCALDQGDRGRLYPMGEARCNRKGAVNEVLRCHYPLDLQPMGHLPGYTRSDPRCDSVATSNFDAEDADPARREGRAVIAVVGGSLSTPFFRDIGLTDTLGFAQKAAVARYGGWPVDVDQAEPFSLVERLESDRVAAKVTNLARPGAFVLDALWPGFYRQDERYLAGSLARTENYGVQLQRLRHLTPFPNIIVDFIGHNNLDVVYLQKIADREGVLKSAPHYPAFNRAFAEQLVEAKRQALMPLIERAGQQEGKTVLLITGLVNFSSYFEARAQFHQTARQLDPEQYDWYQYATMKDFPSVAEPFQAGLAALGGYVNEGLRSLANELNRAAPDHVEVRYVDVFATAIFKPEHYSQDGIHPSAAGHDFMAESVYPVIEQAIRELR